MSGGTLLSVAEKVEKALARISAPDFEGGKAFTAVFAESARLEAKASDERRRRGASFGPLDGTVVSIKALFDVAGRVTAAGSKVLSSQPVAKSDASVVSRLRNAGAIIIGATQMTEFAFSALGTNPHWSAPGNPVDRSRVPGGSSSGAVVSVLDGMAEIAIGSDTGGSVRIPAALSGAVGFKPTSGRIPTAGAFSLSTTLDTIGPIALNVAGCALADQILCGVACDEFKATTVNRFSLVIARGRLFDQCEPRVISAFEDAITLFKQAGIRIREGSLDPALDILADIDKIGTFPSVELRATLRGLGVDDLDEVDPNTRVRIEAGDNVSASDYVRMRRLRETAVSSFNSLLPENELIVLPTTPITAPFAEAVATSSEFHRNNGLVLRNPRVANLVNCPAISIPLPGKLPVGLMLFGKAGTDRSLLSVAKTLEALLL